MHLALLLPMMFQNELVFQDCHLHTERTNDLAFPYKYDSDLGCYNAKWLPYISTSVFLTDCQKRKCESRLRKAPFSRLSGGVVEPYPWFSFSVLRNVHNWIVLYRFRKVQQGEGERGSTCYRSPRGRSFCIIQELGGRRRRHPRATIWIAIRLEQGHTASQAGSSPVSSRLLMVLGAFLRCVGKTWRTMEPWPDSGGRGETHGTDGNGVKERTAAIR